MARQPPESGGCLLLVEDHEGLAESMIAGLELAGVDPAGIVWITDLSEAGAALGGRAPDVILLDLGLPNTQGLETVEACLERLPDSPVVVLTGTDDPQMARDAIRRGASDYLVKGTVDTPSLLRALENARARAGLVRELRRSNEDLSRFAFVAAHDLKAPLRSINQLAELALEDYRAGEVDELEMMLGRVHQTSLRAVRLVEDLLRYARLGRSVETQEMSVEGLVSEVWADFEAEHEIGQRRVALKVDTPGSHDLIWADRRLMRHVFANLFDNAVSHNQGDLTIEVGVRAAPGGWHVDVVDDGAGIPADAQARIFEPFERASSSPQGTGLGLAICRRIVEAHGGTLEVDSAPDEGAHFVVFLPGPADE